MSMKKIDYDKLYADREYYWGKKPSKMCDKVIEIIRPDPNFRPKLLDLGCSEGRNAIYFAKHGFEVVGLDLSQAGLEKTRRYAEEVGVNIKTIQADIASYKLGYIYDIIFSTGVLHCLPPEVREQCFQNYKDSTSPNGINALSVFVNKPFIPRAPDAEEKSCPYKSGELLGYYWDWEILYSTEEIFDCMSSGVPHKHAVNRIIAKKIAIDSMMKSVTAKTF